MVGRSREKIALVVFVVVMVLGLMVAGAYIAASHSLNIAATHIDDLVGNMDDYAVFVYEGTVDPSERAEAEEALADDDSEASEGSSSTANDNGAPAFSNEQATEGSDAGQEGTAALPGGATVASDASSSIDGSSQAAGFAPFSAAPKEPVSLDGVRDEYRDKGASVVELDANDLTRYATGSILALGTQRIGLFSMPEDATLADVDHVISYFNLHEVDFIVALVANQRSLRFVDGIDVVITTQDVTASTLGYVSDGTYYVQAPEVGSVGVVLVAPSAVVSSKVVAP